MPLTEEEQAARRPAQLEMAAPAKGVIRLSAGTRVQTVHGDAGSVRFVGVTHFRDGSWVGIELDRPNGKNDGSVQGTRYFECKTKHGLFTKADKLRILPSAVHDPVDLVKWVMPVAAEQAASLPEPQASHASVR